VNINLQSNNSNVLSLILTKLTVQLRGNVALAHYSTLESQDLDTPYSCSDAPDVSTSRVVNHSRTDLLKKYPKFLVRVEYYMRLTRLSNNTQI